MIKKRIKQIYKNEDIILQEKAYYLFMFNSVSFIIFFSIIIYTFFTSSISKRPGYLVSSLILIILNILIYKKKYNIASIIISIMYPIMATIGLLFGIQNGNHIIYFPLVIISLLFFSSKIAAIITCIYSFCIITIHQFILGNIHSFHLNYYFDSIAGIIILSFLSIILVNMLENQIREKNILIQEINHRVKNNYQLIISTLRLKMNSLKDKKEIAIIQETINRITAISNIHKNLYHGNQFHKINFKNYAQELIDNITKSYNLHKIITYKLFIEIDYISINYTIPCGIILNEAITNSIKHAFQNSQIKELTISLKKKKNNYANFIIQDTGPGFPDELTNKSKTGLTMINTLVRQIDGNIEYSNMNGAFISIVFPCGEKCGM